ncbi:MAG: hypothetical protein P4M01_01545 [Acidobacteriota bacterium]|nr:hypothetical protein [Acidobacteriota bacterium]
MNRLPYTHRRSLSLLLLLAALLPSAPGQDTSRSPELENATRTIAYLRENGASEHPSTTPTVLTAAECNAYLNDGRRLPSGISHLHFSSRPGEVRGEADVDFDQLTNGRTRGNPFLQFFTGQHHVVGMAVASADHGMAHVQIESVTFDGIQIPKIALEYFAARFLRPKFGSRIGVDSTFPMKNRIVSALPGNERVTIVQR